MSYLEAAVQRAESLGLPVPVAVRRLLQSPVLTNLVKFLSVGVVGLAVDLGLFSLLEWLGVNFMIARAVSLPIATLVTWTLNRRHTFEATGRKAHQEAMRYVLVTAVAQSVNYGVMALAALVLPHLPHVIAAFVGSVVATLFSYTGQRFFTFAPDKSVLTAPTSPPNPGPTPGAPL